jgi:hypothetical protein
VDHVLRSEVAAGTCPGRRVTGYLATGQLAPDDVLADAIVDQPHSLFRAEGSTAIEPQCF